MYGAVNPQYIGSTKRSEENAENYQRGNVATRKILWLAMVVGSLGAAAVIKTPSSFISREYDEDQLFSKFSYNVSDGTGAIDLVQPLEWASSNEYTATAPNIGKEYLWIDPKHLMEPYRKTTLEIKTKAETGVYKWEITPPNRSDLDVYITVGSVVGYTCKFPGEYNFAISESFMKNGSAVITRRGRGKSQCRYVRREMRTLNQDDRELFFEAMEKIYWEDCTGGKLKYGSRFTCIDVLVDTHNTLAGAKYCDHMHDGYGFLTQHAAYSRWFELILQLISPSIALPYWDYTIEGQSFSLTGDIKVFRKSMIFDHDWFGSAESTYEVKNGRFAYLPIKWNAKNTSDGHQSTLTNAYGFLRAPWNQNNVPYVTRFNISYGVSFTAVPDCESHHMALSYTSWTRFGAEIMYNPHGPIHILIGGAGNADWKTKLEALDYDLKNAMYWVPSAFSRQKNMYRKGILSCPDICSMDTPMEDCKCTCNDFNASHWANKTEVELLASEPLSLLFPDQNTQSWLYNKNGTFIGGEILQLLCNQVEKSAPILGDSLESASPYDPTFWPIHPTVERLFIWRMMNGFEDTHWKENSAWSVKGFKDGYCWGHNEMDVLTWPNYLYDQTGPIGPFTNRDVWDILNPSTQKAPYIYDNFEWVHCEQFGYNVTLL